MQIGRFVHRLNSVNCVLIARQPHPMQTLFTKHAKAYRLGRLPMYHLALLLILSLLEFADCQLSKELCSCKDIKSASRSFLLSGSDADEHDLRFFAGILARNETTEYRAICSGTVLNAHFLLTTSHFRCPLRCGSGESYFSI